MTTDTVGGVWTFTQELACGLLELGSSVALFSVGGLPNRNQSEWASKMERRWARDFRFECSDAPLEWMQENARAYASAAPALMRLAEEFEAEVFHSNQYCFGALPLEIPKIVTAHSDVLSWSEACRPLPLEESAWLRAYRSLVERGLSGAAAVVAPTRWMLAAIEKNFPMPGKRCVIANGSAVTCRSDRPRKLQAITAARLWDEAKGVDVLREARSPVPMLLAGAASGGNEPRAVEFGQAQLVGELSREDLLELFCESSIYVCPSRYEPFGLAPLEAALCGCAVAARDIPSLREVWGEGAVYFEGTVALERLLTELSGDAQALRQAQARSTERAQRFSRGAMASAYLAAFDELRARDKEVRCVA